MVEDVVEEVREGVVVELQNSRLVCVCGCLFLLLWQVYFFVFCLFFVRVFFGFLEERRQALPNPMQRFVLGVSVSYELSRAISNSNEYLLRYFCPFVSML